MDCCCCGGGGGMGFYCCSDVCQSRCFAFCAHAFVDYVFKKICRFLKHVQGSSIPLGSGSIMMPWKPCRKRYCPWKKSDLLIAGELLA
jgi:hypothetical protein